MTNRDLVAQALLDLRTEIEDTEKHLDDLRLQLRGAEALMDRLGRMRAAAHTVNTAAERRPDPGQDRARTESVGVSAAVAAVLAAFPDGITLQDIQVKMREVGRPVDDQQVRSAVKYLGRRGQAVNVTRGMWRLVRPDEAATPETTEDPADLHSAGSSVLPIRPAQVGLTQGGEDGPSAGDSDDQVPGRNNGDHRHPSVMEG